jgi:cellulose synthase/poly-beta-1,6-N-acetylglucosamine synthase-like glycosyltransferase
MHAFAYPLLIAYLAIIAVFCLYGLHRYWLLWLFVRTGGLRTAAREPDRRFDELPKITVQLPMFNEAAVAERIITAACAIDYPRELLQIQVLDDSTDDSAEIAADCCRRMAEAGHDIQYLHRDDRDGYKAGALANGMASATSDLIAVFDADFVPPPDVLHRTVHHFTDESLGMVQMRWGHLNRDRSLLTRIQAMCLDGHFVIEQTARARTGRWFNFNGTAGIWRRRAIGDAGGWRHDTLTEDTDLSYRAQLAGWKFRYLPHVVCPAEIPPTVGALMTQQHRWNKGLVQTALRLLPRIMRSDAPLRAKIEGWFHLTSPLPYAALLLLTLLILPAFFVGLPTTGISAIAALTLGVCCLALGTFAACAFCVAGQWAQGRAVLPAVLRLPALLAVGVGVSVLNTRAIVEALIGRKSPFVRTPKFGDGGRSAAASSARTKRGVPIGAIELLLGLLMIACIALTFTQPFTLVGLPFILLFACGYLVIGLPPLRRLIQRA